VLRTPEDRIRRSVVYGTLSKDQGELLVLLQSRGCLLDFSAKSVLTSLIKEIAEERHAQRREDKVYVLIEFVSCIMPFEDFANRLVHVFKLR
jgi:hypothetical protein